MAQGRNNQLEIDVVANIRAAQKQIEALVSKPYTLNLSSKGGGFSAPLGKIKGQLGEFEKSLEASNARVIAFGASASAIYAVEKALSESVRAAIEVEKSLKDINVILNLTDKSLSSFGTSLFSIAKSTGTSFATVASAATELSRQGLGVSETLKRTQDALILTRLSGLSAVDAVDAITASLNGFQKTALTSTVVINKLAAVDASFAVSSADLADAIKRVGSSAEDAGVSFDELLAIVTSAQQITARGGAVIGNSFKTIFTRLQRPKVLEDLQQLGIQTQTATGNTRPLIQILTDLAKTYDTLNDRQKASIAETVGGVFQINILKAALGDLNKEYSIFSNALKISNNATDEAVNRNEELNTTLSSLLNKTIANLTAAGAKIGELSLAPALKKVFGGLNSILESFDTGDSEDIGSQIGEGLLRGLGNFLSGPGLIVGAKALFMIFERLTVFTADAAKTILNLNSKTSQQAQLQQQIFNVLSKNPEIIAQINSGETTLAKLQESILITIKAQTLAMEQQVTLSKTLAASLSGAGVAISKAGPTLGRLQAKAGGFVPNLFAQEEQNAKSMGAVNPRAQISQGTIGGQKFIKNNKEMEIVGAGRNGDSAVIPTYGSIGDKRQKEYYDKLKFLGFVPNFARKFDFASPKVSNKVGMIYPKLGAGITQQEGVADYGKKKVLLKFNSAGFDAKNIRKPKDVDLETQLGNKIVEFTNSFAERIFQPVGELQSAAKIKSTSELANVGGFGSILGSVFETAVDLATGRMNEGRGPNDRIDFADPNPLIRDLFYGIKSNQLEAKSSLSEGNRDSVAQKMLDIGEVPQSVKDFLGDKYQKDLSETALKEKEAAARKAAEQGQTLGRGRKISSARRASGFIPNFSSVKDAMETEKKMGGSPALDFQEGIGLYVRDKNTQSNFSAVKRDHPEGIDQAMKNSQRAQESLARGFIPNFAPKLSAFQKIPVEAPGSGLKKAFDDQAIPQGMKQLKDNIFSASFALSTLSGVVESFNKDGNSMFGEIVSEGLKGASTFTSIAAVIPGQVGLIIGAFAGVNQAIEGFAKSIRDAPINKIIENSKLSAENFSRLSDSTQKYAITFEKLQEIYKSDKPFQDVQKGEQELSKALLDVPPQYRNQLASAKNLTEIQDIIAKALASGGKDKKQSEVAAGIGGKVKEAKQSGGIGGLVDYAAITAEQIIGGIGKYATDRTTDGFGATTGTQLKGGVYTSKGADAEKYARGDAEKITSGLNQKFFDGIANKTIDLNQTGAEFIKTLSEMGLSLDEEAVLTAMLNNERGAGKENFNLLAEQIKQIGLEANDANIKIAAGSKARQEEVNKRKAAEEAARLATKALEDETQAKATSAEASRASAIAELKLGNIRQSNVSRIANAAASSELQTAQPFTTAKGMAVGQAAIEKSGRINTAESDKKQAAADTTNTISSNFSNAIQKQLDAGKGDTKQLQEGKAKIAGIVEKGGGPEKIAEELKKLGEELKLEDIKSIQSETATALQGMKDNIALVDEELKTANTIAAKQLQEQIKQIRNQERTKALGGMQGFLNPESLKEPVEKLLGGFQKAQTGKKYGLENTAARGYAEAGMASLELTGGAGSADINAALKDSVVPQQTKFIEQTFKDLATQSRATGTPEGEKLAKVFDSQAADAGNIAAAQFDAAFQKEKLPQNVADILKEIQKMNGGGAGAPETSLNQGIEQAQSQQPAMTDFQKIFIEEAQKAIAKDPTIAQTMPTMRSGEAGGYKFGMSPEETKTLMSMDTSKAPTSPVNNMTNKATASREYFPDLDKNLSIGEKGALTSAEADKYLSANMKEQDRLREQAGTLSTKQDNPSQQALSATKQKLSDLSERYKSAEGTKSTLAYGERPVEAGAESMAKKLGRSRAEMQSSGVNEQQRMKEAADRALGPKDNQTSTSKGEVNVSFTPISIDLKGSIETANDELNEKMTDAIKQAVEQLAPGILSKIYGPPRDKAKS